MPYTAQLNNIIGPFLIATVFDCILFGVVIIQGHYYFNHFPSDSKYFQATIWTLLFLCLYTTCAETEAIYSQVVLHFGDVQYLNTAPIGFTSKAISTSLSALIVQGFYSYRIYALSERKWYFPAIIMTLGAASLGFACVCLYKATAVKYFSLFREFTYAIVLWLALAAATDVIITAVLVYFLRAARTKTVFVRTRGFLGLLIQNTIENNLLTAVVAVIDALTFALSDTAWHVLPNGVLGKLYTISILSSLNARRQIQEKLDATAHTNGDGRVGGKTVKGAVNEGFMPSASRGSRNGLNSSGPINLRTSMSEVPDGALAVQVNLEIERAEHIQENAFPIKSGAHRGSLAGGRG